MEVTLADGRVLEHLALGDPAGRPVVLFPGTPATAGCGALVADAAAAAGVRLIAVSRPGYGGSSSSSPGLGAVARDTLELLDQLGVGRCGVHGISGGGPFALALAALAPDRVERVVVSAGPGSLLELGRLSPAESMVLAQAQSGDADEAWRVFYADAAEEFGDAAGSTAEEFRAGHFPAGPPPQSYFDGRPEEFAVFVADMHRAVQRLDGCVQDNLSWCGTWDIDLGSVRAPVLLAYGHDDTMVPALHGEWLAARLPNARLQLLDGGHGDITFGRAADAYAFLVGDPA